MTAYPPATLTRPLPRPCVRCTGVDHGGMRRTSPPGIWSRGDASANCPPLRFLSYRYKKERSVAFKIRQNPFSARTPLGELTTLPRPPSRLERGHPSPYPTPFGTDPPSVFTICVLLRIPTRSTPMVRCSVAQSQNDVTKHTTAKRVGGDCTRVDRRRTEDSAVLENIRRLYLSDRTVYVLRLDRPTIYAPA